MKAGDLPLVCSIPFSLIQFESKVQQVGNAANGYVALVPCSTPEEQEVKSHLLKCWNDRVPSMPADGETIFYTVFDHDGEERINISIPDEDNPRWRNVRVHFPGRAVSIDRQQLAELGHLFLALSSMHECSNDLEPDPDMDSVVELLDGYGFHTYVNENFPEPKECSHPHGVVIDEEDPITMHCPTCEQNFIVGME